MILSLFSEEEKLNSETCFDEKTHGPKKRK